MVLLWTLWEETLALASERMASSQMVQETIIVTHNCRRKNELSQLRILTGLIVHMVSNLFSSVENSLLAMRKLRFC